MPNRSQAVNLINNFECIGRDICIRGILNTADNNRKWNMCKLNIWLSESGLNLFLGEEGKLQSFSIDRSLRKSVIMVKNVYYCQLRESEETDAESKTQTVNVDENQVSFIGHIESDIIKGDNYRAFTICIRR